MLAPHHPACLGLFRASRWPVSIIRSLWGLTEVCNIALQGCWRHRLKVCLSAVWFSALVHAWLYHCCTNSPKLPTSDLGLEKGSVSEANDGRAFLCALTSLQLIRFLSFCFCFCWFPFKIFLSTVCLLLSKQLSSVSVLCVNTKIPWFCV